MATITTWSGEKVRVKYQVAYKNWLGVWITCSTRYTSKAAAEKELKKISKTKALNGQATIFSC